MMRFFQIFFIVISLMVSTFSSASHIIGGEMFYDCLGNDEYQITVKLYRDCNSTGAAFDPSMQIGIFGTNNPSSVNTFVYASFPGSNNIPINFSNPCLTAPGDVCVEVAVYTKVVTLSPIAGGYDIVYQRCCRGPSIQNLTTPEAEGITLTTHIPGTEGDPCNSSPRFNDFPPLIICQGESLTFDHSATDPDGDQLVYSFATPFTGGTAANPAPTPSAPPHVPVGWAGGYSASNPLGGGSVSTIAANGDLVVNPNSTGIYTVAIKVEEYRNGVKIGETIRDFQFLVVNCVFEADAVIVPQTDLVGFTSYCDGLTIDFEHQSLNAQTFAWNFDDPASGVDNTSDVNNPTHTFSQPGTYDVQLIINPGLPCADTAISQYTVREGMELSMTMSGEDCITDNSFDFDVTGDFDVPTANYSWTFDQSLTPTPSIKTPSDIIFTDTGYHDVKIIVQDDFCIDSLLDSVFIYVEPSIGFTLPDELRCAPYVAHFTDTSFAHSPISYLWNFGDGSTSVAQNPIHTYDNAGTYDVSLRIYTTIGCIDTLYETKIDEVTVYPSPEAEFTVNPIETTVFFPFMTFTNTASNIVNFEFYFAGNDSSTESPYKYAYQDTGYLYPMQVVWNQYGCPDTTYRRVYIEPITTYYAPNAFTPNGDGRNDVFQPVVKDVYNYEFRVYSRWGDAVFYSKDQAVGWDGTIKGKPAPADVYVYTLYFKDLDYYPKFFKGHFTLIR